MTHSFCVFGGISLWILYLKNGLMKTTIISRLHTNKHVNWKAKKEKCVFFFHFIIFHQLLQQYFLWASTSTLNADGSDIYNITNTYRDTLSIGKMCFFFSFYFVQHLSSPFRTIKIERKMEYYSTLNIWRQYQHACIEHWKRLNTIVTITYMVEWVFGHWTHANQQPARNMLEMWPNGNNNKR